MGSIISPKGWCVVFLKILGTLKTSLVQKSSLLPPPLSVQNIGVSYDFLGPWPLLLRDARSEGPSGVEICQAGPVSWIY